MMDEKDEQLNSRSRGAAGERQTKKPAKRAGKVRELVDCCRNMTTQVLEQVNDVLENGKDPDRLKAAELILAYGWGKPTQQAEGKEGDTGQFAANDLSAVEARIRELLAKAPAEEGRAENYFKVMGAGKVG